MSWYKLILHMSEALFLIKKDGLFHKTSFRLTPLSSFTFWLVYEVKLDNGVSRNLCFMD